jgi:hypothetical protein
MAIWLTSDETEFDVCHQFRTTANLICSALGVAPHSFLFEPYFRERKA